MVELACGDLELIDCEIVISVNIIPPNPEDTIKQAVLKFRREQAKGAE